MFRRRLFALLGAGVVFGRGSAGAVAGRPSVSQVDYMTVRLHPFFVRYNLVWDEWFREMSRG